MRRNRLTYGLLVLLVMAMGLASRRFFADVTWVNDYVGDVLWALMVFLGIAATFNRWSTQNVTLLALLFSFTIELSQLYHAPWIDQLRSTKFGGLVLGFTFVWSDFVCYSMGVLIGVWLETYQIPRRFKQ